jgi:hypothetical protein
LRLAPADVFGIDGALYRFTDVFGLCHGTPPMGVSETRP